MATALKLISIFGRQRADKYLKGSLSQKSSENRFTWAVRESIHILSPTTFKEAEEEAFDVVPNVGVPDPATLKKALPDRVRQFEKCGGASTVYLECNLPPAGWGSLSSPGMYGGGACMRTTGRTPPIGLRAITPPSTTLSVRISWALA